VQNPMIGTEFEKLEYAEPHVVGHRVDHAHRKRVLVIGAGITGLEAARVLAGRGHEVEVWEKSDRPGGQVHLAIVAPDKKEVVPAWAYRWREASQLGVPVRNGVEATSEAIRRFAPDFVIVATGARPRPIPFDTAGLAKSVRVVQSWEYLAEPSMIADGATVTIVGGGMVGLEVADMLTLRGARVSILEVLPQIAPGMARNNRMEVIDRLEARGAKLYTNMQVLKADGDSLRVRELNRQEALLPIGDVLMIAIGPTPNRDVVPAVEEARVEYALAGDAYRPGDFLTCVRDACMLALSIDARFRAAAPRTRPIP
jgi:dimethylglycine catabolism A